MKLKLTWLVTLFFVFYIQLINAQQKQVSGTIIDQDGIPLEGVTVIVDGTNRGVVSDFDGIYAIYAQEGEVLKISFIGMKTEMVKVGVDSTINVTMKEDLEDLDAVIITGYQNVQRELFTGASQTIKAKEIKLDGVPDISRALEGRAAGVRVCKAELMYG